MWKRFLLTIFVVLIVVAFAFARAPKHDYQWTGLIVEMDNDHLVVEKGRERWEFAYDKDTRVTGTLKLGAG